MEEGMEDRRRLSEAYGVEEKYKNNYRKNRKLVGRKWNRTEEQRKKTEQKSFKE